MNIFSFFSGAGFLDLGFELQGNYNVVFVNEFHKAFNEVYQYVWNEKTGEPQKEHDHVMDSVRYCLYNQHKRASAQVLKNIYI